MMQTFPIHALTETDLDRIAAAAGGIRAHPDADRRKKVGADYVVGGTVIELKMLDEEGFDKPERQAKLAELFRTFQPNRPVVVLDSDLLPEGAQQRYRNIVEQPIKPLVKTARRQLAQSRTEFPKTKGSVLWVVNNGYTALDHGALKQLIANRVRQDTSSIDGVIVSGCYYHSDGFDGVFLWPCDYVPIRLEYRFPEFPRLQEAFQGFANSYMTELMQQIEPAGNKLEVRDLVFDLDDVRFVRPAPMIGKPSDFYVDGRPRANSSGIEACPAVALIVPGLRRADHALIAASVGEPDEPLGSWQNWLRHIDGARKAAKTTRPLVTISVEAKSWLQWCQGKREVPSLASLNHFACEIFDEQIRAILGSAREHVKAGVVPSAYILAVTQEIGRDRANDVSDIAFVRERATGEPVIHPLVENIRIFHEHAVALAAAYALRERIATVLWIKNSYHGWI